MKSGNWRGYRLRHDALRIRAWTYQLPGGLLLRQRHLLELDKLLVLQPLLLHRRRLRLRIERHTGRPTGRHHALLGHQLLLIGLKLLKLQKLLVLGPLLRVKRRGRRLRRRRSARGGGGCRCRRAARLRRGRRDSCGTRWERDGRAVWLLVITHSSPPSK